jgi:hypothetical protein
MFIMRHNLVNKFGLHPPLVHRTKKKLDCPIYLFKYLWWMTSSTKIWAAPLIQLHPSTKHTNYCKFNTTKVVISRSPLGLIDQLPTSFPSLWARSSTPFLLAGAFES